MHLRAFTRRARPPADNGFPFNVPVVQTLEKLTFDSAVTFFVGENGSGKSTLLETLACAIGSITIGSESVNTDPTLTAVRQLAKQYKLTWHKRTKRGFFLRAEDFFGYAKWMSQTRAELQQELDEIDESYHGRSELAKSLAKMPYANELHGIKQRYGEGLDTQSHGESFLKLFQARFVPDGLYLLDEPEAPLSPLRQLTFLSLLKEMVSQNAQFIIATHSPLILAFPEATIISFDDSPPRPVAYDDLEHVTLTRSFLNNPDAYLRHL